jgi:hypothetical protein
MLLFSDPFLREELRFRGGTALQQAALPEAIALLRRHRSCTHQTGAIEAHLELRSQSARPMAWRTGRLGWRDKEVGENGDYETSPAPTETSRFSGARGVCSKISYPLRPVVPVYLPKQTFASTIDTSADGAGGEAIMTVRLPIGFRTELAFRRRTQGKF